MSVYCGGSLHSPSTPCRKSPDFRGPIQRGKGPRCPTLTWGMCLQAGNPSADMPSCWGTEESPSKGFSSTTCLQSTAVDSPRDSAICFHCCPQVTTPVCQLQHDYHVPPSVFCWSAKGIPQGCTCKQSFPACSCMPQVWVEDPGTLFAQYQASRPWRSRGADYWGSSPSDVF